MEGLEELEGGDADWCEAKYGLMARLARILDTVDNGFSGARCCSFFTACQAFSAGFDIYDFTYLFH